MEYLICLLYLVMSVHSRKLYDFKLVYEWKQIEYKFRSEAERSEAIANGTFNVGKVQPLDVQYAYEKTTGIERIFVTTPRFSSGFPATLGVVTNETRDGNPIIDPYPSWSWQINPEQCNYYRIVSVLRTWVDECNRLWVLDQAIIGTRFACPPQILTFDLKTDKLLYRYEIPYERYQNTSWYVSIITEVESRKNACENTWVYADDTRLPSLLVYSLKQNVSWRVQDNTFKVNPNYVNFSVAGEKFQISDGLVTMALTPASDGPLRKLRYHPMSNVIESWIYTKHLKDPKNFVVPFGSPQLFHTYKYERNQQSSVEATDRKGNLYFTLLTDVELIKWDPRTPYRPENFQVIADNKETITFPSGLQVTPYKGSYKEALWMFSTAFQRFAVGKLNGNITNFRLFVTFL